MTEAMPFLRKFDITFLRPPTISDGVFFFDSETVLQDQKLFLHA